MVVLWQMLLAGLVTGVVLWAWMQAGQGRVALALAAGVLAAFFGPWLAAADWGLVGRVVLWSALALCVVGAYGMVIGRIRAAARKRDGK